MKKYLVISKTKYILLSILAVLVITAIDLGFAYFTIQSENETLFKIAFSIAGLPEIAIILAAIFLADNFIEKEE